MPNVAINVIKSGSVRLLQRVLAVYYIVLFVIKKYELVVRVTVSRQKVKKNCITIHTSLKYIN